MGGRHLEPWESLASYRHCVERVRAMWGEFLNKREQRLEQQRRLGQAAEKVAENILEDLFTTVLDWPLSSFNNQVERADIVLTDLGIKRLVVEVKRPGSLAWHRRAVEQALDQAARYAAEQKVRCIAVSDGVMFYAADVTDGGLRDRTFISLAVSEPQDDLWWLSTQGIWRDRPTTERAELRLLPEEPVHTVGVASPLGVVEGLLHPKYKLPARCFAYVGDYSEAKTWKLPYLLADATIDGKRLPKAIQAILSNYRGVKVSGIPEEAIRAVLSRLARAALQAGHLPPAAASPALIYQQLAEALDQLGVSVKDL
jgi:hypothetical protein